MTATIRSIGKSPKSPHEVEQRFRELKLQLPPATWNATTAPSNTDDFYKGWRTGSTWVVSNPGGNPAHLIYICTYDARDAPTNAIWQLMTGTNAVAGGVAGGGDIDPAADFVGIYDNSAGVNVRVLVSALFTAMLGTVQTYTASNVTTDRSYDANATTVDELADVVGTLIADLRAKGIVA